MNAVLERHTRVDFARWGLCLLLVIGLHASGMFWLRHVSPPQVGLSAPATAVLIDLAPEPVAPPETTPEPPAPEPVAEEPPPVVPEVAPPPPVPEAVPLPRPVPPVAKPRPPPVRPAIRHEEAVVQPALAAPARSAPAPAAPSAGVVSARWESVVAAYIARFKHYPVAAQRRGDEGVAVVRFSVDRSGNVSAVALVRSSGHADLDSEAAAWIARAQPVPPPPPELPQTRIELQVPLRFALH